MGDWGYFQNYTDYLRVHPGGGYQGENVINVGNGQWWGFPGGTKTAAQWDAELQHQYKQGGHTPTGPYPGWQPDSVTFWDVPAVGELLFDVRRKAHPPDCGQ